MIYMDLNMVKEKIEKYVLQAAYAGPDVIVEDTMLFKEGYFDSMGFIMLLSFIDEEFGIKVSDDELLEENFESINAITEFIFRKLN
jgi:acyl carrier protein